MGQFRYICIRILTQCRSTSHCKDVQSHFLDVNVYKWMLSSTPIEVEVEVITPVGWTRPNISLARNEMARQISGLTIPVSIDPFKQS